MATPNCPRCQGEKFKASELSTGADGTKPGPLALVHCAACGCVVGAAPWENSAPLVRELKVGMMELTKWLFETAADFMRRLPSEAEEPKQASEPKDPPPPPLPSAPGSSR